MRTPPFWLPVRTGLFAGLITGLVCTLIYVGAKLLGVSFTVLLGPDSMGDVDWAACLVVPILVGLFVGVLGGFLRIRSWGTRVVLVICAIGFVLTIFGPIAQPIDVAWSTRMSLMLMHIVTLVGVAYPVTRAMSPLP